MKRAAFLFAALGVVVGAAVSAQSLSPSVFGRFGRFNDDGLLTLDVLPTGFHLPPIVASLSVQFGDGKGKAHVVRLDSTGKTLKLSGGSPGEPTEIRYTLLYPGFSALFGRKMRLRFVDERGQAAPVELLQNGVVIQQKGGSSLPVQMAFAPGLKPSLRLNAAGTELLVESRQPLGEVRFLTPLGIGANAAKNRTRLAQAVAEWQNRPIPTRLTSSYALTSYGQRVVITDTFAKPTTGEAMAPLPPVLAFALQNGYPAKVEGKVVFTDCLTKYGPFAYVKGTVLRYSLPVPPTDERGYLRLPGQEKRAALLNSLVGHLGGDWVKNAVDLGYAGMTNAQLAEQWLSPKNRTDLQAAWKKYLPLMFTFPPYPASDKRQTWKMETEPFSQQSYLWTYFIGGPDKLRYDIEWGNTLPLYGLQKYAQYTGDWNLVRKQWPAVQKMYRYLDLADDWAWMTTVNADHGYSTGTGDPMAAAFCGSVACLKMARAIGDKRMEAYFAMKSARIAVPTVAKFWHTKWARQNDFIGPQSVVLGFHETEGFTRSRVSVESPWNITSVLSADGVLPELYDALLVFGGNALRDFENLYSQGFPKWYDGNYKYPFNASYAGNSVYATFPHIFALAVLNEPIDKLWKYVDACERNRDNAWVGPNVIAEILNRNAPLTLTEWQPAAWGNGSISAEGKKATLVFSLPAPTNWRLTARLAKGKRVQRVLINGRSVSFTAANGILQVRPRVQGRFTVAIEF